MSPLTLVGAPAARRVTIVDALQRTPAWLQARCGQLTSSRAVDMLSTPRSGQDETAGRRNLRVQLALERITGRPQEGGYVSAAMRDGITREPQAREAYELLTGHLVTQTGFVQHPTLRAGASLDGHVGDLEGIVELKCPLAATHLEYLKTGVVPMDYQKQIVHLLWLTGAAWCDWLSFHPEFPEALQTKLVRVARDEAAIACYAECVARFLAEVDAEVEAVRLLQVIA